MPPKQEPLTRKGEPTQRTKSGLEIPIPTPGAFFDGLGKAAATPSQSSARRAKGKPRTSRAR
jgi:hypothetical protein